MAVGNSKLLCFSLRQKLVEKWKDLLPLTCLTDIEVPTAVHEWYTERNINTWKMHS